VTSFRESLPLVRAAALCRALLLLLAALLPAACDIEAPFMGLVEPPPTVQPPPFTDPALTMETDFNGSIGALPSGWALSWVENGSNWHLDVREGRTVLVDSATSDGRRNLIWEAAGELFNPEILMLTKVPGTFNRAQQWIAVRATGGPGQETGMTFQIRNNGFRFARYRSGSLLTVGGNPLLPFPPNVNDWYWVRLQVDTDIYRAKIWAYGDEEPEFWSLIRWNDDLMVPGHVGVGRFDRRGDALFAYFAVSAGGEPPPQPPTP
jgi:hypothetical protein